MKGQVSISAKTVYEGSNGGVTRSYCCRLEKAGPMGRIAAHLFRAQKASARAKVYRGGIERHDRHVSYREVAYEQKSKRLNDLCHVLASDGCGMSWGWGVDPAQRGARFVLYLDLPQGQVSFHSTERFAGPDYDREWDGSHKSEERIIAFCDSVMGGDHQHDGDGNVF